MRPEISLIISPKQDNHRQPFHIQVSRPPNTDELSTRKLIFTIFSAVFNHAAQCFSEPRPGQKWNGKSCQTD